MQRVAIAGFGAIGKVVAEHLDRGIDGLALAAVSARDVARAEAAMAGFACRVPVWPLARLGEAADIVVECAPAAVLREIAEPALAAGRTLIVLSCGAPVDNFDLVELARRCTRDFPPPRLRRGCRDACAAQAASAPARATAAACGRYCCADRA